METISPPNFASQQTSIQLLSQQIGNLAEDIRELRKEVSAKKPNIALLGIAATIMITMVSALWWFAVNLAINPVREHVDERFLEASRQQAGLQEQIKDLANRSEINRQILEAWLKKNAKSN